MKKIREYRLLLVTILLMVVIVITTHHIYRKSQLIGVLVRSLSYSELTAEEQRRLPYLFKGDYYVLIKTADSNYHAIKTISSTKENSDTVQISNFMNAGEYLLTE